MKAAYDTTTQGLIAKLRLPLKSGVEGLMLVTLMKQSNYSHSTLESDENGQWLVLWDNTVPNDPDAT